MKHHPFLLIVILLILIACEEIPPEIRPAKDGETPIETPVSEQKRQVLIEEFSGVRCVNCPAGSDAIQVLLDIYGPQLVPVNIHAGFFAEPYPESRYDLQTQAGYGILEYLGQPLGFPTAVINRKQFPGEDNLQLTQRSWAGRIAEELLEAPTVKIDIRKDFAVTDRLLLVNVDLYFEADIAAEDVRLSVYITENGIEDFQLTPEGKVGNYEHLHVLREVLTDVRGDRLTETIRAGTMLNRRFTIVLPEAWRAENCEIVALVHQDGDSKKVLQAHRSSVE
ncbi:Omp28 family outer membrane lipoprotein [Flavilitoribacter nigricans]|uniref:Omp28-related outer membrane protein n=1 Tax=Flavilitoribacter nigricans (strain ATCC 23147 / DSM 23189 / NBRC 102662 / NCIMB 1420 / SS-2) TaxID=1122177 RepID=A0A2D0NHU9_FLAN2|nr:Omp28 family outer membrane lipoprotein [Flavilitoribacter nigricans]PHN08082.1 hypothetical protein CRP01_03440 [Flavilitoribacter nigricans DSM 23189 = NBRC 102662]